MTARWVVSDFTALAWRGGRVEITATTSGATFATTDLELARLVHAFARPRTIEDVIQEIAPPVPEQVAARIDDLIRAGVLANADEREAARAHHWDPAALAYHRRSRSPGPHRVPIQTVPAVAMRTAADLVPLVRGAMEAGGLAHLLETRRSTRAWLASPIAFKTFSRFLWTSARNRELSEDAAVEQVSRPYPSGGACYSLELYPILARDAVETLASGVYRYLPERHALDPISTDGTDAHAFLEAAARSAGAASRPPVVVLATSRFARQSEVYGALAYSLVLKEVGCLFQTMYLVGELLGLGVCALGGGTPIGRLARLCRTTELTEPVVGELALGLI